MHDESLSHTSWNCQYHIVFIPKYRRKILYGRVRVDLREIIRKLCDYKKIRIIEGSLQKDHVHLCVAIPPKISVSDFVGYLKGKSAPMMFDKHPELGGKFDRSLWARGYYVSTIGNVNEEIIREYIRKQEEDSKNEQ